LRREKTHEGNDTRRRSRLAMVSTSGQSKLHDSLMMVEVSALRIGQVAKNAGVSPDTIRHYERLGLLPKPARTPAGYRQYPPSAVSRVTLVRQALRFGFSLRDVARFLRVRASGCAPCGDVRTSAERILAAVDQQIRELTAARETIRQTLADWDRRLAHTPANRPAHLLESLKNETALPKPFQRADRKAHR
jgi:DNA-binding transcriptional MerR regulator